MGSCTVDWSKCWQSGAAWSVSGVLSAASALNQVGKQLRTL